MMENITYTNIRRIDNLEFDKYLELPGYSFSFLKGERNGQAKEVPLTDKIAIGKIVDAILTEDGEIDMLSDLYPIARKIAFKIQDKFGSHIKQFAKQISFLADANYQGYAMLVRGRTDYILPGHAVIDLKVTFEENVRELIKYMKYDDQLWNYSNMAQVKRKYIMIHSVPLGTTEMVDMGVVNPYNEFWSSKILKFGTPVHESV